MFKKKLWEKLLTEFCEITLFCSRDGGHLLDEKKCIGDYKKFSIKNHVLMKKFILN